MKRLIAALTAFAVLGIQCSAAAYVLGKLIGSREQDIGMGTYYYNNVFESEQESVGKQTEYYYEYKPNKNAVPIVVNGSQIYGKRTIMQAAEYMQSVGQNPLMGINADYFSFKTGIPMGHTIIDGEIVTKDGTGMNAIGFRSDGTAFISWLQMMSTMRSATGQAEVDNINKWCQPNMTGMYMMSDSFGKDTKTSSECQFVVLTPVKGKLEIGTVDFTLRVDESFTYTGAIAIPKGKYVIAMDAKTGNSKSLEFLKSLKVGEEVTICCTSVYDSELWESAQYGIGSIGGRLVEKGVAKTKFEAGAAPRSAVGIKADGTIVFYVIDGRQTGHSYGVQLKTLAARMAEIGCVDAINLDGGGSTVIGGKNGEENFIILNSPSDGTPRPSANFLFLNILNYTPPAEDIKTGIIMSKPAENNFLSGSYYAPKAEVFDENGKRIEAPQLEYSVKTEERAKAELTDDGMYQVSGHGPVTVSVEGEGYSDSYKLYVFETPDDILLYDGENEFSGISAKVGDNINVDLRAQAFLNSARLVNTDTCFEWSVEEGVGSVDKNGIFTLESSRAASGYIVVRAGEYEEKFPVIISSAEGLSDIKGHWSEVQVSKLYDMGIVNGSYYADKLYYYPDDKMTRAQFAALMCSYLGIKTDDYIESASVFADYASFSEWMLGCIGAASKHGIMSGRTDGTFCPNDYITRAEASAVMARTFDTVSYEGSTGFADDNEIPEWAREHIGFLRDKGIVNGYWDNTFKPSANVTRAEAAVMVYRLLN